MLRDYLQEIYDSNGQLTPELVVETARPKGHPLHPMVFDRAPKEAAEAWYRHRAHELIQSVRVIYANEDDKALSVRAWCAVRSEKGHVYEPSEKVAVDPFLRQVVLADMEREWRQLHGRYGTFTEFVELVSASLAEA